MPYSRELIKIVKAGTCIGCGACVALVKSGNASMTDTPRGPVPLLNGSATFHLNPMEFCPAKGIHYPDLYNKVFSGYPDNWLTGHIDSVHIGYSRDDKIRNNAASGGIISSTLIYLLQTAKIDAAIVVKQGLPVPEKARVILAHTAGEIMASSQSVYIPVSTLDILVKLEKGKKYAITCLPEQSAVLRKMQLAGFEPARQVKYILGPYTGTALYPDAIHHFLRTNRIKRSDRISSLKWRAGEWPGHLEIITDSGKVITSKKVYYNFLIPFFITRASLQSMDFCNEFADLSVGDAWSPEYEKQGKGFSVVVSRNTEMTGILSAMRKEGLISLEESDAGVASEMHGHMIDFKKRGSYIRNRIRRMTGRKSPDFGYAPKNLHFSRILVELVIDFIFLISGNRVSRFLMTLFPEKFLGPVFNGLRLKWKNISKPAKRKGLREYKVKISEPWQLYSVIF
jgi:coenzyme F420 hydrogenase subunit beta